MAHEDLTSHTDPWAGPPGLLPRFHPKPTQFNLDLLSHGSVEVAEWDITEYLLEPKIPDPIYTDQDHWFI